MGRALLLSLMVLGACANETGILINVSAVTGFDESAVTHVRLYVGVDRILSDPADETSPPLPGYFVDENPLADLVLDGRLLADPYTVLIKPNEDIDRELAIGAVAYNADDDMIGFAALPSAVRFKSGSVLEWRLELRAAVRARERPWGAHECVRWRFGSEPDDLVYVGRPADEDCDRFPGGDAPGDDCEDRNPNIYPGRKELCDNGFDDNCNAAWDGLQGGEDNDNDGYFPCTGAEVDWDDHDATTHPGAPEICDGKDNNQDGLCNNWDPDESSTNHPDPDGDGFCVVNGDVYGARYLECGKKDYLLDCQPNEDRAHPGAEVVCNGEDNDCDGNLDSDVPCTRVVAADAGEICRQGRAVCAAGQQQECQLVDGELEQDICDCDQPRLLQCAAGKTSRSTVCDVLVDRNGQLCDGESKIVLGPGLTGRWTIIGGTPQQGYDLRLGDGSQSTVGTNVELLVAPLPTAGNAFVTVQYDELTLGRKLYRIELYRWMLEEGCQGQALACDPWPEL